MSGKGKLFLQHTGMRNLQSLDDVKDVLRERCKGCLCCTQVFRRPQKQPENCKRRLKPFQTTIAQHDTAHTVLRLAAAPHAAYHLVSKQAV